MRTGFPFLDDGRPRARVRAPRRRAPPGARPGSRTPWPPSRHAVALGYRYLETDVHVTSDGVLLAFHDARARPGHRRRRQPSRELDVRDLAERPRRRARAVPTLADLLERFPDARFNIDLKSDAAVAPLATFVARSTACRTGSASARSPAAGCAAFRRLAGRPGRDLGLARRGRGVRRCSRRRLARLLTRRGPPPCRSRTGRGPLAVVTARPGTPRARRGPPGARVDRRRPRRDGARCSTSASTA